LGEDDHGHPLVLTRPSQRNSRSGAGHRIGLHLLPGFAEKIALNWGRLRRSPKFIPGNTEPEGHRRGQRSHSRSPPRLQAVWPPWLPSDRKMAIGTCRRKMPAAIGTPQVYLMGRSVDSLLERHVAGHCCFPTISMRKSLGSMICPLGASASDRMSYSATGAAFNPCWKQKEFPSTGPRWPAPPACVFLFCDPSPPGLAGPFVRISICSANRAVSNRRRPN